MAHSLHYSIDGGSQQPSKDYLEWHLVNLQDFSSDRSATLNILPAETYFVVNMSQQQQQQGSCCHGGSSGLGGGCCRRGSSGGCCSRGTTGGGGCCGRRGSSGGCCSRGTGPVYVQQSQQTARCCCINRSGPCCGRCCGRRCGGGCCGGGSTQLKQK
ncbi:Loricrin, partial [Ophiophagus hannah]